MHYLYDKMRHLVCVPYSIANLHAMAQDLGIGRHWFDPSPYPHYDVPKRMMENIGLKAKLIRPREVLAIVKGWQFNNEQLVRCLVREEVDRLVRSTAGMVGGADVGKSSGNRPPTMSALGGNKPAAATDDVMGRAEELYIDLGLRLERLIKRGHVSLTQVAQTQCTIDQTLLPLIRGDKDETPDQLQAIIDSLTDAVDALEKAV